MASERHGAAKKSMPDLGSANKVLSVASDCFRLLLICTRSHRSQSLAIARGRAPSSRALCFRALCFRTRWNGFAHHRLLLAPWISGCRCPAHGSG